MRGALVEDWRGLVVVMGGELLNKVSQALKEQGAEQKGCRQEGR